MSTVSKASTTSAPSAYESWPSAYELQRRERRERSLVVNALLWSTVSEFAGWLGALVLRCIPLTRNLRAGPQLRRGIRTLQQFDDRALADIGLGRSEIEYRCGLASTGSARQPSSQHQHVLNSSPAQRRAA